jgi:hypothetical protein
MKLLGTFVVENDIGEYSVHLYESAAYVSVHKRRGKTVYRSSLLRGSSRSVEAIMTLFRRSEAGSLARECLDQCDDPDVDYCRQVA